MPRASKIILPFVSRKIPRISNRFICGAKNFHGRIARHRVYNCAACADLISAPVPGNMPLKVKDTLRATVHLTFDGRVIKAYHGPNARERFDQETKVLKFLEQRGCPFVPRL